MGITKLAGGYHLTCGHQQVIASYRLARSAMGLEQPPVWCIECEDWSELPAGSATKEEAEAMHRIESMIDPHYETLTKEDLIEESPAE